MRNYLLLVALTLFSSSASPQEGTGRQQELQLMTENVFHLSEVMLHDVANPPAASRFYAYSLLGAYEVAFLSGSKIPDLGSKFNVQPGVKAGPLPKNFNLFFCANYAMLDVGRQIMPSGYMLEEKQKELINYFKTNNQLSDRNVAQQVRYSQDIARQVVEYARGDGYGKLSTYTRYTPSKEEGRWYPTPPEYMSAIEPSWETIQSFVIDSANQFPPLPPTAFNKDTTSSFHTQMMEVYSTTNNLSPEQREIAAFWDCNPFAVTYSGHMAIGLKKISPGGHWMGITGIVCQKANTTLDSAIFIHTLVAITLHDAFISCWQEKYRSDRIRPESAINKMIDPAWRPLLQTPPFPEYTSGHSVVSASAATVLTYVLGDNFSFIDTSEKYFGLPDRHFNSFYEASNEAAISRLYGGIHFRDACEQGVAQGKSIGEWIIREIFGSSHPASGR
ncbi:MAG TPA: vanadium-dependent haloperoxidase [Cyclobacteriaceae bacterium]|nr:vanadium-dependent haloperoxidase [Cyclobacteriaceae bacterium]